MTDCFVLIKDDYRKVSERFVVITGGNAVVNNEEVIIYDDFKFEDKNGWCLITLLRDDSFAEEVLLGLSDGKQLLYFYSDDTHMDCEFLLINNGIILRKKYIYFDTPELNEDKGHLKCENIRELKYWNDIDYVIGIAKITPDALFELD